MSRSSFAGRDRVLLLSIAAVAAGLRFTGLDWGLRHPALWDEQLFVDQAQRMFEEGNFDHRFYYYPGLFFYLLVPVLRFFGGDDPTGPTSVLAARAMVAGFGTLNVLLLHRLARDLLGRAGGLFSAALLAVSPVAVETAHLVRPDVVLQTLVLLALLAFRRVGTSVRSDLLSGAALGLAGGLKFSGIFLLPSYLAARSLAPGRRMWGLAAAGCAASATFAIVSPYSILNARQFGRGVHGQPAFNQAERPTGRISTLKMAAQYALVWPKALGWPAALLALLGLARLRSDPRTWIPLALLPLVTLGVMATSQLRFDRHMLPSLGVPILLAAAGLAMVAERRRSAAVVLAGIVLAVPLYGSVDFLRGVLAPGTRDRVLDWLLANAPADARILFTADRLGLWGGRWEVLQSPGLAADHRRQAVEFDYLVTTVEDDPAPLEGLDLRYVARPASRWSGPVLRIHAVPPPARLSYRKVTLRPEDVRASAEPQAAGRAADGDPATSWTTGRPQQAGDRLEIFWASEAPVGRVELRIDADPKREARALRVFTSRDGLEWAEVDCLFGRPRADRQAPAARGFSQVLLIPPTAARALRLELARPAARRWAVDEVLVYAVEAPDRE